MKDFSRWVCGKTNATVEFFEGSDDCKTLVLIKAMWAINREFEDSPIEENGFWVGLSEMRWQVDKRGDSPVYFYFSDHTEYFDFSDHNNSELEALEAALKYIMVNEK